MQRLITERFKNINIAKIQICILLSCLCMIHPAYAQTYSFNGGPANSIINYISTNQQSSAGDVGQLSPNNGFKHTKYDSGIPTPSWTEGAYIEIQLKDGSVSKTDNADLVVYTRRVDSQNNHTSNVNDHPIAFKVVGQFDGSSDWKDLFNVYFVYRGACTDEYSTRIPISDIWNKLGGTGTKLTKMRFYITATNGNIASDSKYIEMALNRFDVLKVSKNSDYSSTYKDGFHLVSDYRNDLYDYKFRHTQGIFDDVNKVAGWDKITDAEKTELLKYGIEIPEFEKISSSSTKNKPRCTLAAGHELQPTHEVEHILYAMPGDVINLYPYYEMYHTYQFYENFNHWYDYRTGGRLKYPSSNGWSNDTDLLDFLTDPEKIQISDKYGFFAGFGMAGYSDMHEYTVTNGAEYIAAVNEINTHKEFSYIKINAGVVLDFSGYSNVPMLGDGYAFKGIINGNGATIKNLKYEKTGTNGVGLIGTGGGTVVVKNLILDSTCKFVGKKQIGGIVGYLDSGNINISDVRTEATLYSEDTSVNDHNAGGLIGACGGSCTGFKITNCFIGGNIGDNTRSDAYNAAVIAGWWGKTENSTLKNVVVDCKLLGPDNSGNGPRYYIRHGGSKQEIVVSESGIKTRGGISFENCYGDLQTSDECWQLLSFIIPSTIKTSFNSSITQNADKWNLSTMMPPMMSVSNTGSHSKSYTINNVAEYIDVVNEINGQKSGYAAQPNAYVEIASSVPVLDFSDVANVPMLGISASKFKGHFNGNGCVIKGLRITGGEAVGMFGYVDDGSVIENLVIDQSCSFIGQEFVGLIGWFIQGTLTVNNIHTEATIKATKSTNYFGPCAGGILGLSYPNTFNKCLRFKNIYIGGNVDGSKYNSSVVGFLGNESTTNPQSSFTNIFVNCSVMTGTSEKQNLNASKDSNITLTNCYSNINKNSFNHYNIELVKEIAEWKDAQTPAMTGVINKGYNLRAGENNKRAEEHKPGTVATFFCPKNPYEGMYQSLPFPDGTADDEKEYMIAADFSKTFDLFKHLDVDEGIMSEPIIAFRHIFKIRDGKEFADENFGSYTDNRKYVRRNQKMVSARCNAPFQIRLTTPVPVLIGSTVPTNIYYKKSADEYDRVRGRLEIILLDGDTREVIKRGDSRYTNFYFGDEFKGVGERTVDGVSYSVGDGTNSFYRMLKCTPPGEARHYIVQLVATENPDYADKRINVYRDPIKDADVPLDVADPYLIVAEYNITFLPMKGATMLTMDHLYDKEEYAFARVETLEEKFGKPIDVINFDEYININHLDNVSLRDKLVSLNETKDIYGNEINPDQNSAYKVKNKKLYHNFFKWPIPWNKANYAYGFNYRDGYNMYMLASHSDQVFYKQAVLLRDYFTYGPGTTTDWTDEVALNTWDPKPIKGNRNADYHGKGLYDVKYYRSKREIDEFNKSRMAEAPATKAGESAVSEEAPELEQGYFYWGNAASDPGVATRLEINDLCPGSTIHVSAWISEFSIDSEASNLSFNFVAVMKNDNEAMGVKAGDRIVLHSFITGYVPDGGKFYQCWIRNSDGSYKLNGSDKPYTQQHWVYNVNSDGQYYDLYKLDYSAHRNNGQTTTTGVDDDMRGQWLNVYYSFVPRIAEFELSGISPEDVYYELELDNNAKSSAGADFGIDDIRIYLEPPMVDVTQLKPACDNASTRLRLESPFETLLEIVGQSETLSENAGENLAAYYTFINKPLFGRLYEEYTEAGNTEAGKLAYEEAVVKFNYNRGSETEELMYGKVVFNSNYKKNEDYMFDPESVPSTIAYKKTDDATGERFIVFESDVSPGKFDVGSEYYVVMKAALDENGEEDTDSPETDPWTFFDMFGDCANKNVISIRPSMIVKINGKIEPKPENLMVCENQSPVVQVNVTGTDDETGEMVEVEKNAYFDWFYGLTADYKNLNETQMDPENGDPNHTLEDALWTFRQRYPEEESVSGISADADDYVGNYRIFDWMLKLIEWACRPTENTPVPLLTLYKSSFVLPPLQLEQDETKKETYVVVIPITCMPAMKDFVICTSPAQVKVTVCNKSPKLKHGLNYLPYPQAMTDVPLRLGLDQLRAESSPNKFDMKTITIPVRYAASSDNSVNSLTLIKEEVNSGDDIQNIEGCILLVQTNDPEYKDLGTLTAGEENEQLLWVGEVTALTALTGNGSNMENNMFKVRFYEDIHFKEGYFYRMRFQYQENISAVPESGEDQAEAPVVCLGQDVFTIKIVPKYQLWTGKENLNWNNDDNWVRVGKDELYLTGTRPAALAHYITDGSRNDKVANENMVSYAPLDFTYVIIGDNGEDPYLYAASTEEKKSATMTAGYQWAEKPSEKKSDKQYADYPDTEKGVGEATPLIQYDMAAFYPNANELMQVGCRPWYMNTCKEIHFKPGGTIMNQQELTYEKAWVDMELDHSRWQTLSSPLQEVFAGDFYLPSKGARQTTELYQEMTFDNSLATNHRFKPAVYQRGWDKSVARVYELENQSFDSPRNVAVRTFWSNVYNDVTEEYGGVVGFSLKTDVTDMTQNKPGAGDKVLFRLPKADEKFLYFNEDGSKSGHETTITRGDGQYRLNDSNGTITATTASEGQYFLVGNPFMTHMDIKKFLDKNNTTLEQKYWVITESGQIAGSLNGNSMVAADPTDPDFAEDPTVIAPMQGFFVKAINPSTSVKLSYDKSMMRRYDSRSGHNDEYLTGVTRGIETSALRITSENDGYQSSAALLMTDGISGFDTEAIDNRDLDIPSTVYTAKDGKALSISSVEDAEGVEIGVIADEDTETVIRFNGVETTEGLYLLDKVDRSLTPLEEGLEVTVNGMAAGRLFLTRGIAEKGVMSGIEWSVDGGVLNVNDCALSGVLEVSVYDTVGRLVTRVASEDGSVRIPLDSGLYVVDMKTSSRRESAKIRL